MTLSSQYKMDSAHSFTLRKRQEAIQKLFSMTSWIASKQVLLIEHIRLAIQLFSVPRLKHFPGYDRTVLISLRETTELAGGDSDIKLICRFAYLFRGHTHLPGKLKCGGTGELPVHQNGLHFDFKFAAHCHSFTHL